MAAETEISGSTAGLCGGMVPTLWSPAVDLLYGVIQAYADRGEAHLSVQPCH